MQVQHKQAIVVLQKVLIVTIFITISAMCAHATTLIGEDIRDILSKIESQAFLNTKNFCKSDSDYYGIPLETIQRKSSFEGNNGEMYELILAYSNKLKNTEHANDYVDKIYVHNSSNRNLPAYLIDGIRIIQESNGQEKIAFTANADIKFDDGYLNSNGIFEFPEEPTNEIIDLIFNRSTNSTGYSFLNTRKFVEDLNKPSIPRADVFGSLR